MQPPSGAERAPRSRLRAARPPGEAGFDFPRRGAEGSGACGVERLGRPRCPQAPGTKARRRLGKGRAGCCSLPGFGSLGRLLGWRRVEEVHTRGRSRLWPPPTAVRPRDPLPSAFQSVKWAQSPARGHSASALTCAVPWGRRGDPGPPPGPRLATEGGGRPAHPARSEALGGVCQGSEPGLWGRDLDLGEGRDATSPASRARPGAVPCNLQTTPTFGLGPRSGRGRGRGRGRGPLGSPNTQRAKPAGRAASVAPPGRCTRGYLCLTPFPHPALFSPPFLVWFFHALLCFYFLSRILPSQGAGFCRYQRAKSKTPPRPAPPTPHSPPESCVDPAFFPCLSLGQAF